MKKQRGVSQISSFGGSIHSFFLINIFCQPFLLVFRAEKDVETPQKN